MQELIKYQNDSSKKFPCQIKNELDQKVPYKLEEEGQGSERKLEQEVCE